MTWLLLASMPFVMQSSDPMGIAITRCEYTAGGIGVEWVSDLPPPHVVGVYRAAEMSLGRRLPIAEVTNSHGSVWIPGRFLDAAVFVQVMTPDAVDRYRDDIGRHLVSAAEWDDFIDRIRSVEAGHVDAVSLDFGNLHPVETNCWEGMFECDRERFVVDLKGWKCVDMPVVTTSFVHAVDLKSESFRYVDDTDITPAYPYRCWNGLFDVFCRCLYRGHEAHVTRETLDDTGYGDLSAASLVVTNVFGGVVSNVLGVATNDLTGGLIYVDFTNHMPVVMTNYVVTTNSGEQGVAIVTTNYADGISRLWEVACLTWSDCGVIPVCSTNTERKRVECDLGSISVTNGSTSVGTGYRIRLDEDYHTIEMQRAYSTRTNMSDEVVIPMGFKALSSHNGYIYTTDWEGRRYFQRVTNRVDHIFTKGGRR